LTSPAYGSTEKAKNRFKNSNLVQAWLVLLLAMSFGAALAAVQVNLSDIIAANKLNETLAQVPKLVKHPAAQSTASIAADAGTVTIQKEGKTKAYSVFHATVKDRTAGWVIKSAGQGYADRIELLIGLDPQAQTITGIFVLDQKETPGLGNKIIRSQWRSQFINKKTHEPLSIAKSASASKKTNAIDAITGATISSRAVTAIVNQTIADVKGHLTPPNVQFIERRE
jgi:electron transport complex protein RnfG